MGCCCSKESKGVAAPFVQKTKSVDSIILAFDNFAATSFVEVEEKSREQSGVVSPLVKEVPIDNVVSEHRDLLSTQSLILGRHERTLKARQFLPYDAHTIQKPTATARQPWTDKTFPHEFENDKEGKTIKLTWKRPKAWFCTDAHYSGFTSYLSNDFHSDVRLFGNAINRYSVKQGQASDCFFISTLSAMADHPEYIKQIFSEDAYETDPSKYTGIVHCQYWWMGEWIDVYTDDVLPYHDDSDDLGRYVGAHSDDKNIVWVPLAEKALARLYGSYPQIAGNPSEVFRLLTGGLVEELKTSKDKDKKDDDFLPPDKLFERVDKVLKSGSTVLTNISEEVAECQLKGLVPNHTYSVTGVLKIEHQKQVTKLLRIRNPWGEKDKTGKRVNDGEWKGRWSYTSKEWKEVDETLRKKHNVHIDKGGEFWVCMEDFFELFVNLYICDRIPNFDRDGFRKEDGLDKVINILGEWHGATSAGNQEKNKMRNPRFILTIPGQNNAKALSVVIEVTRQFENPANSKDDNDELIGVIDIYKIEKEEVRGNRLWMSLNKQTVEKKHIGSRTTTYLCKLSPGDHLLLPYFYDSQVKPPVSKSFCVRIFTNVNARCSQMNEYPTAFHGTWPHAFGDKDSAACILNLFGEWKGETAAGHTKTKMRNPKFILTIPDINSTGQQATVLLQLRCNQDVNRIPKSDIDVFRIEKDQLIEKRLWRSMKQIPEKEKSLYVGDCLFKYELIPGNYLLLPFFHDEESIACEFCIRILASCQVQCRSDTENPVMFVRKAENSLEHGNQIFKLEKVDIVFGEWVKNLSAGGQISNNSFDRNPQYGLSVTGEFVSHGNANQPVLISVLQENIDPICAIGCHIIQIDADFPVTNDILRKNARVEDIDGKTHPFMYSSEANGHYMLSPGRYLVLVFAEKPTDEKKFALVIAAQTHSKIILTELST